MWVILGIIIGLLLGRVAGNALHGLIGGPDLTFILGLAGAVLGGFLGAPFGARRREGSIDAAKGSVADVGARTPGGLGERVQLLEQQVDWLYRESLALRRELAAQREASGASPGAMPGHGGVTADTPASGARPVDETVRSDDVPVQAARMGAAAVAEVCAVPPASMPSGAATAPRGAVAAQAAAMNAAMPRPSASESVSDASAGAEAPTAAREGLPAADREIDLVALWQRITGGNPLAKVGVVLLFFGVASALRLAAEYGLFPVPLRLFLAAAGGVGLIVFGLRKVEDELRRNFGLALQGGGFAVLYLVVYFMLARYAMLGAAPAFALFAALGVGCVLLAARQDGPALAVFGMAGAFLAPVLAGGRADSPVLLFSYFTLLNVFILIVDWRRAWQVLNIAGFLLTLVIGMSWAIDGYRPEHYLVTQFFLALFLVMYSATPVAAALLQAPGFAGWQHGLLVFGVPLAGAFLQSRLMLGVPYGLAWSALFASLYYFGLWALLFRRRLPEAELIERSHLGLAIAFLTVSVPLAFDAQVTSAFWAVEGAAVLWFGTRQKRTLAQATGLGMQAIAGLALLQGWDSLSVARPVFNDAVLGGMLIAAAGITSARLLRRLGTAAGVPPAAPFVWAMLWWLGVGLGEIDRFAATSHQAPFSLLFVAATVVLIEAIAQVWRWPQARRAAVLLLPAMWLATLLAVLRDDHPLAGLMLLALPLAYVVHGVLLLRHLPAAADTAQGDRWLLVGVRHVGGWWLALLALPLELGWLARELMPGSGLWPALAWGLVWSGSLLVVAEAELRCWPRLTSPALALRGGALLPIVGVIIWSVVVSFVVAGDRSGLPYLPLLNPVDLAQLFALYALWRTAVAFTGWRENMQPVLWGVGFVWWSTLPGRIVHLLWGVPFDWWQLWDHTAFQALLTLLWTLTAIGVMIRAARERPAECGSAPDGQVDASGTLIAARRQHWYAGFALLVVVGAKMLLVDAMGAGTLAWTATLLGVAVLVLAASYFAPLPPRAAHGYGDAGADVPPAAS